MTDQALSPAVEDELLLAAVERLPIRTRLSLLRDASSEQNVSWLRAASAYGLLSAPANPVAENDQRHHPEEWVRIAALASVLDARSLLRLNADPYSGEQVEPGSEIFLSSVAVKPEFLAFFRETVQSVVTTAADTSRQNLIFAAENSSVPDAARTANIKYARQAAATAGVLLSTAAALNDTRTIQMIDGAFSEARMAAVTAPFLPSIKHTVVVRPLATAFAYGQREAVESILSLGFDPEDPVAFRSKKPQADTGKQTRYVNENDEALSAPKFIAMLMSEGMGLFAPPSVFDRYFDALFSDHHAIKPETRDDLIHLSTVACDSTEYKSLLPVLKKHGILEFAATDLAANAIRTGNLHVLPYVIDGVDWGQWSSKGGSPAPRAMETFLPIAALKANGNTGASLDKAELADLAAMLTRKCIEAGHGSIISVSDQRVNALRSFVDFDLPECMLMSLEMGADPLACPNNMPSVKELCEDTGAMETVLNSFLARKAAEDAIQSIGLDFLGESGSPRP